MDFTGKVCIVTGGTSGVGRCVNEMLIKKGAKVATIGRNPDRLKEVKEMMDAVSPDNMVFSGDVATESDIQKFVSEVMEKFGRIDVLINCAGIMGLQDPVVDADRKRTEELFRVNYFGPFTTMKYVIPEMLKNEGEGGTTHPKGKIVNIASSTGISSILGAADYGPTKAALIHLTKQTAVYYSKDGIICNAVCPTGINTPFIANYANFNQEAMMRVGQAGALVAGGMLEPEDVARATLYLASDESAHINGIAMLVDDGLAAAI